MRKVFQIKPSFSLFITVIILLLTVGSLEVCMQFGGALEEAGYKIPSLSHLTDAKPAITTGIADAVTEVPFLDDFNPERFVSLRRLDRGPHNGFILDRPGLFELNCKSYCLHAGSYGPRGGDGYVYAPLRGPRKDMIQKILQKSVDHTEIPQSVVQTLIWAVLARANIGSMSSELQDAADILLSHEDIDDLNSKVLSVLRDEAIQKAYENLPPAAYKAFEAENKLRSLLADTTSTYEDLERVAVLVGDPEETEDSREIPGGRWSYHTDGYFVRYFPASYRETLYQIYVPEPYTIERDTKDRIKAISDNLQNRIEFDYDDKTHLIVPNDSSVKAYALASIRFINFRAIGPEIVVVRRTAWENSGWTLVGIPGGKGRDVESLSQFPGIGQRYREAQALFKQVTNLENQVRNREGSKSRKSSREGTLRDAIELAHLAVGMKAAIGDSHEGQDSWTREHAFMVKKAWQYAVCEFIGSSRTFAVAQGPGTLLIASLNPILPGGSDDPCDNPPDSSEDSPEGDPSDGTAVPGNSGKQRIAPSGSDADSEDPHPDCGEAAALKSELETIRNAFENNKPHPGEKGFEYAKRIEGMFGYGDPGGATSPMQTTTGCGIIVNESYYQSKPSIFRASDCAHEKTHQAKCRWARDNVAGGYMAWMDNNAWNYRQNEIDAYNAGIKALEDWVKENGCGK